ncbi:hypothetical protein [Lysobacter gummosus]|uniref:hypothetical protein n=1 Tax=Lysobacter gummosus TaxID=262324 RepID=UPI00363433C3
MIALAGQARSVVCGGGNVIGRGGDAKGSCRTRAANEGRPHTHRVIDPRSFAGEAGDAFHHFQFAALGEQCLRGDG